MKYILEQFVLGFKEGWREFWAPAKRLMALIRKYLGLK